MKELQTIQKLKAPSKNTSPVHGLTKESLFWLNLENAAKDGSGSDYNTTTAESSALELTSSSSSLASYDSASEDHKHAMSTIYGTTNASNSSIGTLVQKPSSSTSTLNLQARAAQQQTQQHPVYSLSDDEHRDVTDTESLVRPSTPERIPRKIKSSLKLPGLTRCKSMPNTAGIATSKTVRFSNDLTRVKTFNEHATPSAISLDNSPEVTPPEFNDAGDSQKAVFDLQSYFNSSSSSSDEEEDDYFNHRLKFQNSRWNLRYLNFNLFDDKYKSQQPIKLTSLSIVNNYSLVGTVEVSNFAFEKYVEIKFTTDDWKSIYLITAQYDTSLSPSKDQFKFEILLSKSLLLSARPKATSTLSGEKFIKVGLCIKYVSKGTDHYYDNNNNQNYQLELINKPRERTRRHKRYSSEHLNKSLNALGGVNNRLNFGMENFKIATATSSPSKPSKSDPNFTSTRYFSDDTDYFNFNSNSTKNPNFKSWMQSSSVNFDKLQTQIPSSSSSLNTTPDYALSGPNSPVKKTDDSSLESYEDFLKKYCFFKTPNTKESHETVFIS